MIIFLFFLFTWLGLSFRFAYVVFAIISVIVLLFVFRKYKWKLTLAFLSAFFIGVGISYINIDIKAKEYSGFVIESKDNYFLLFSRGEKLYVYQKDHDYEIGDYLKISGTKEKIDFTVIESQFDFNQYLFHKGVNYSLSYSKIQPKFQNPIRPKKQQKEFLSHFDEQTRQVVGALLFSNYDSSTTIDNIESLHLSRLVNMSGIYIYVFLAIIEFFLSFLLKKKWASLAANGVLLPYYIFTFPRFAVLRIFILQIVRWINKHPLNNKFSSLDIIGIVGLFFILADFHLCYQDSFIIGFTLPIISSLVKEGTWWIKGKIKKKILEIVFVYLMILPFEIKYYHGINPFFLPLQYLFIPLFVIFAIICLLCFYKIPIYGAAKFFLAPINFASSLFNKINFSINVPALNEWLLLLYGLLVLSFFCYRSIRFVPIYKTLSYVILTFIALYCLPINNFISESVTFINVGQGDSCLIRKGTTTIMVDTGGSLYMDIAKNSLIPYLKSQRIYNIDLLITTHDDFDHIGAMQSLENNFYIKKIVSEQTSFPIDIGGIRLQNYNQHTFESKEENEQSLVIGFHLLHKDFLIMGDAPIKIEQKIMIEYPELKCDILKVGHHGSKTSTCSEFVQFLNPELAVISCGKNNKYGHPHQEVINVLNKNNIPFLRTDLQGTIRFSNYIFM